MNDSHDAENQVLANHLRKAAMGDRPAFSPALHRKLKEAIANQADARPELRRWVLRFATGIAAAGFIAMGVAVYVQHHASEKNGVIATKIGPPPVQKHESLPESITLAGGVTAQLFPPSLQIPNPLAMPSLNWIENRPKANSPVDQIALVQAIKDPMRSAQLVLGDIVPAPTADLLRWYESMKQSDASE